ncbi:hypothetical protein AAG747_04650 [Rapidithrix thailandica]|uniref:Alpha-L-rhamnosidase six-hairpin glycosidase domain-containing protein n=1 Tax=Rapidithrix thailandica TaxID=413964 RepID=A0AAW9RQY7_9BACT
MMRYLFLFLFLCLITSDLRAQGKTYWLKGEEYQLTINAKGQIVSFDTKGETGKKTIPFQSGEFAGPSWFASLEKEDTSFVQVRHTSGLKFQGSEGGLLFSIEFQDLHHTPAVVATVKNTGYTPVQPQTLGLRMGLNTYMEKYPDWNHKFFPNTLRCEKTHFWGYAMAPDGRVLNIASPDPIAAWSNEFTMSWGEPGYQWHGHRITSLNLNLINALPLPDRHPQNLYQLKPGEEKSWVIYLKPVRELEQVPETLATLTSAPFLQIDRTTIAQGEQAKVKVISGAACKLRVVSPSGKSTEAALSANDSWTFEGKDEPGVYRLTAISENGKQSEAMISVRNPWHWYLNQARKAAIKYPARATTHCETWYGLYTLYLAQKYDPDQAFLTKTEVRFQNIFPQLYDEQKLEPIKIAHRIQNTTTMIGVLVDRYQATGDFESLRKASGLADWVLNHAQAEDGSYRAGNTHYTSVIYPAKSIMELFEVEKELGKKDRKWKKAYQRHYTSVKAAMDELVASGDNIDTEGQLTYEDGMISCSALQLAKFALLQQKEAEKQRYAQAALKLLKGHRSLTQLLIPDSRQRNATLRFWESQYDVYIQPNMFNSPHGWTSWRTYATYYAYLLTGDEDWLIQTFNALGSSVQVIDFQSGDLRWAFVPNPYVPVIQTAEPIHEANLDVYNPGHYHPLKRKHHSYVLGEQYVDMISDWIKGNSQDNDVHEHFKCMEETVLTNAFVVERANGELVGYNCKVREVEGKLQIHFTEGLVRQIHFNLASEKNVEILHQKEKKTIKVNGAKWVSL